MRAMSYMPQRLELLTLGEQLGWPRIAYGYNKVLRAGKGNWENHARRPISAVMPVLRHAKIRAANLQGRPEPELTRVIQADTLAKFDRYTAQPLEPKKDRREVLAERLAKARAAKAAKRAAAQAAV